MKTPDAIINDNMSFKFDVQTNIAQSFKQSYIASYQKADNKQLIDYLKASIKEMTASDLKQLNKMINGVIKQ